MSAYFSSKSSILYIVVFTTCSSPNRWKKSNKTYRGNYVNVFSFHPQTPDTKQNVFPSSDVAMLLPLLFNRTTKCRNSLVVLFLVEITGKLIPAPSFKTFRFAPIAVQLPQSINYRTVIFLSLKLSSRRSNGLVERTPLDSGLECCCRFKGSQDV
jgi:hypothetical protein